MAPAGWAPAPPTAPDGGGEAGLEQALLRRRQRVGSGQPAGAALRPHGRHLGPQRHRARRPQGARQRGRARRARPGDADQPNEQDTLNPIGVNCIRSFPGRGHPRLGRAHPLQRPGLALPQRAPPVQLRREVDRDGTQWVVFEPNDMDLWARVRRDVTAFLTRVWRDGALFGATPAEAFYVKCDAELNPLRCATPGQLIVEIGIAPSSRPSSSSSASASGQPCRPGAAVRKGGSTDAIDR